MKMIERQSQFRQIKFHILLGKHDLKSKDINSLPEVTFEKFAIAGFRSKKI